MKWISPQELADLPKEGTALLYFTARWCSACRYVEPLLSDAGLPPVWAVDVDQDRYGLVEAFHLSVLPTLILQRDGNLLARLEGTRTLEQIKDMVNQ